MEFADYRRYSMGDDPRSLDWSAYLRLGKLFLKIYETEQHIPVRVLLDRSESMDCEGADESKFLYAQRLAATFAYLALLHLDTAAVVPFAERLNKPLVVSGGRDRLWPVLEFLGEQILRGGRHRPVRVGEGTQHFHGLLEYRKKSEIRNCIQKTPHEFFTGPNRSVKEFYGEFYVSRNCNSNFRFLR